MQVIQCDRCQAQSATREGWTRFEASYRLEPDASEILQVADAASTASEACELMKQEYQRTITKVNQDLCPDCSSKVKAGVDALLHARSITSDLPLDSLKLVEQRHIMHVLTAKDWNKSHAARILGVERSTLDRKLKLYKAARPHVEAKE